jgi:hypothetical protein
LAQQLGDGAPFPANAHELSCFTSHGSKYEKSAARRLATTAAMTRDRDGLIISERKMG